MEQMSAETPVEQVVAKYKTPHPWFERYLPANRWFTNGHVQTIAGNYLPRKHDLPEPEAEIVEVEAFRGPLPASHVLCHCHWQPESVRASRMTVLLVHGVEGSSDSHYIRGNATKAWRAGCNVIRMNMRNCGDTELLCPTLYHCGLSNDVRVVIETFVQRFGLQSVAAVGYSMGGNLVLKYVGELGANPPKYLKAAVGVSPAMDLAASSAALHSWQNRIYERTFLRGLLRRFRYKAELFPYFYDVNSAKGVRSMRDFDNNIVARYCNFADALDYYTKTTSSAVADKISVPTLIIHALDDPFIRMTPETRAKLVANPHIRLIETDHGGHCAFLARPEAALGEKDFDGYWAEHALLHFLLATTTEPKDAAESAFRTQTLA
jgi:predicted alpha/beta-fold hydrolase